MTYKRRVREKIRRRERTLLTLNIAGRFAGDESDCLRRLVSYGCLGFHALRYLDKRLVLRDLR